MFHSAAVCAPKKSVTLCSAGKAKEGKTYISHLLSCAGGNKRACCAGISLWDVPGNSFTWPIQSIFLIKKNDFWPAFMVSLAATASVVSRNTWRWNHKFAVHE